MESSLASTSASSLRTLGCMSSDHIDLYTFSFMRWSWTSSFLTVERILLSQLPPKIERSFEILYEQSERSYRLFSSDLLSVSYGWITSRKCFSFCLLRNMYLENPEDLWKSSKYTYYCEQWSCSVVQAQAQFSMNHNLFHAFARRGNLKTKRCVHNQRDATVYISYSLAWIPSPFLIGWVLHGLKLLC